MGQQHPRGHQSSQETKHSKFPKVSYQKKGSEKGETMEVELGCDEAGYKKWKLQLKSQQKSLKGKTGLLLPQEHKYSGAGLCSQQGVAKVVYGRYPYILEDEIRTVRQKKSTFSEPDLWRLIYSISSAKKQYAELNPASGSTLGGINPSTIFINQQGHVALANPLSWPNFTSVYQKAVIKETQPTAYLSPQDMKLLELGAISNDNNEKSEIFETGMTLLSAGLVEDLGGIYNFQANKFDDKLFQEKRKLWKTTMYYSEILRAVVLALLHKDPKKRLTFAQLDDFLKPHAKNIQAQKPLTVNNANKKLDAQIEALRRDLPELLKYRFDKYSPQKTREKSNGPKKISIPKQIKINNSKIEKIRPPVVVLNSENSQGQIPQLQSTIRVKSPQTRFTYSNKPLENFTPARIVVGGETTIVPPPQPIDPVRYERVPIQPQQVITGQVVSQRSNRLISDGKKQQIKTNQRVQSTDYMKQAIRPVKNQSPQNQKQVSSSESKGLEQSNSQQIAKRLISKGGIKHTDSQIEVATETNRQSLSTQINKLQRLSQGNVITQLQKTLMKASFQQKQDQHYHTYSQVIMTADFEQTWNEFIEMIRRPDNYFPELKEKIHVTDETIEVLPGRVKLQVNKEEGKIHLENVSKECKGEILGGVSKNSAKEVQVWLNSSYTHKDKPFPPSEYFIRSLQLLKDRVIKHN